MSHKIWDHFNDSKSRGIYRETEKKVELELVSIVAIVRFLIPTSTTFVKFYDDKIQE